MNEEAVHTMLCAAARKGGAPWRTDEIAQLRRLAAQRMPWNKIAGALGRSALACKTKYQDVRHGTQEAPRPLRGFRAAARAMDAARDQRLGGAPCSLTAAILGDPPPGRSALDQKRAMSSQPRITLPGPTPSEMRE